MSNSQIPPSAADVPWGQDPLDAVIERGRQQRAAESQRALLDAYRASLSTEPKAAADEFNTAKTLGVPRTGLPLDLEHAKKWAAEQQAKDLLFNLRNPGLEERFKDVPTVRLLRDDFGNLKKTVDTFDWFFRNFEAGSGINEMGFLQARRAMARQNQRDLTAAELDRLAELQEIQRFAEMETGWFDEAAKIVGQMVEPAVASTAAGLTAAGAASLGGPISSSTAGLWAGASTMFAYSAVVEFGHQYDTIYDQLTKNGYTHEEAHEAALIAGGAYGLGSAALETLGGVLVGKPAISAARKLGGKLIGQAGLEKVTAGEALKRFAGETALGFSGEVLTEGGQEMLGALAQNLAGPGGPDFTTALKNAGEVMLKTAKGMAVLSPLTPALHYAADLDRVKRAHAGQELLTRVKEAMEGSVARERTPDVVADLVNAKTQGTSASHVYIESQRLAQGLLDSGQSREQLAKDLPDVARQLAEGVEEIAIPMGDFAAKIAPTKLYPAIQKAIVIGENGFSIEQAERWVTEREANQKAVAEKIAEASAKVQDWDAQATRVQTAFAGELQRAFPQATSKQIDQIAIAHRLRVEQAAAEAGMTPEQWELANRLSIVREDGAPRPERLASLDQFGGELAKTADLSLLAKAEELEKSGASREDILAQTGWFRGVAGHWSFEISDKDAKIDLDSIPVSKSQAQTLSEGIRLDAAVLDEAVDLGTVLDHPVLRKAYPGLDRIRVLQMDLSPAHGGFFAPLQMLLVVNKNNTVAQRKSTILHELQHVIQDIERHPRGGDPTQVTVEMREEVMTVDARRSLAALMKREDVRKLLHDFQEAHRAHRAAREASKGKADDSPERGEENARAFLLGEASDAVRKHKDAREAMDLIFLLGDEDRVKMNRALAMGRAIQPGQVYWRLAGEAAARNTQARADLDDIQRRQSPPWVTVDTPEPMQIVAGSDIVLSELRQAYDSRTPLRILGAEDGGRGGSTPRYGTPREGSSSVFGVHFSPRPRESLSGDAYGTGLAGAERKHVAGDPVLSKRIHFYVDTGAGITPEVGVGEEIHAVTLDNVYDTDADKAGILQRWRADNDARGYEPHEARFHRLEQMLVDAGFDGIYVPRAQGTQGVAVLLGPKHTNVPVSHRGNYYAGRLAQAGLGDREAARSEPPRTADGKIKGAPEWVKSRSDLNVLRRLLRKFTSEGESGRYWYERSSRALLAIAGGKVADAEKLIQLVAIYSPRANLWTNMAHAIRVYTHWKQGKPAETLKSATSAQDQKAIEVLYRGGAWDGRKTNSFYLNLMHALHVEHRAEVEALPGFQGDPSLLADITRAVTVDLWMLRAAGYANDQARDDAGAGRYAFVERELQRITGELNLALPPGAPRWTPFQVQAAIWSAIKTRFELPTVKERTNRRSTRQGIIERHENGRVSYGRNTAEVRQHLANWRHFALQPNSGEVTAAVAANGRDFASEIEALAQVVTWEAIPSSALGHPINSAPPEVQRMFTAEAVALIHGPEGDNLAQRLGVSVGDVRESEGAYAGGVSPNVLSRLLPGRRIGQVGFDTGQVRAYARALQYIFRQDAVPWLRLENRPMSATAWAEQQFRAVDTAGRTVRRFDTQAAAEAFAARKGLAVRGGALARAELLRFAAPLTIAAEKDVLARLQQHLGPDVGFTRVGDRELLVVNFRDDTTKLPFARRDEDFEAAVAAFGATHGASVGLSEQPHATWIEGEYGPTQDWKTDAVGEPVLAGTAAGRPDLDGWLRGRRAAFDQLLLAYGDPSAYAAIAARARIAERPGSTRGVEQPGSAPAAERGSPAPAPRLGQAAKTDTPEFKAWFGDSKVVDARGKPLRMFHGTANEILGGVFDHEDVSNLDIDTGLGTFFSSWASEANYFTLQPVSTTGARNDTVVRGGQLLPVYLSIQKPKVYETQAEMRDAVNNAPYDRRGYGVSLQRTLIAEGYDGVIVRESQMTADGGGMWAVAFHPTQIKSVNNAGSFDPRNPNILRQGSVVTSPPFRAWFGDSKVVDKEGKPLVVHHAGSFDENEDTPRGPMHFGTEKAAAERSGNARADHWVEALRFEYDNDLKAWFWRSGNDDSFDIRGEAGFDSEQSAREDAQDFADSVDFNAGAEEFPVTRAYLSIQNPKRVFDQGTKEAWDIEVARAKAEGHDGLVYRNLYEDKNSDSYVVFEPGQIKSINNDGTFDDPNDILSQENRGEFDPSTNTIFLREGADLSTILHELSHFWLFTLFRAASSPNASARVRADAQTLLNWFGVKDLATWNAMSLEEQRPHHEAFAYNAEANWFGEGENRAPTNDPEMVSIFRAFGRWVRGVYRNVRDKLNAAYRREFGRDLPGLTPDVRAVFDRMLASEDAVEAAKAERGMQPMFTEKPPALTDAEWRDLQQAQQEATDSAVETLQRESLRALRWTADNASRIARQIQASARATRRKVEEEERTKLEQERVFKALSQLRHGVVDDNGNTRLMKLSLAQAKALGWVGDLTAEEAIAKLGTGASGVFAADGLPLDTAAQLLGFGSGAAMVRQLAEARPFDDVLRERTDGRMLAEHSDLVDPEKVKLLIEKALHNPARARAVAAELKALGKAVGPVRMIVRAARAHARDVIGKTAVGQVKPHKHAQAAARHRNESLRLLGKDVEKAASHKRRELLEGQMEREAIEIREVVEKTQQLVRKLFRPDAKLAATRDIDYIAIGRYLAAAFGMAPRDAAATSHLEKLKAYNPALYERLLPMVDRARFWAERAQADGRTVSTWQDLTADEFRDFSETLEALWQQAKNERLATIEGKQVELEAIGEDLEAQDRRAGPLPEQPLGALTPGEMRVGLWGRLKQLVYRPEHWAHRRDGAKEPGAFTRYFWRPIRNAINRYVTDRNRYTKRIAEMVQALRPKLKQGLLEFRDKAGRLIYTFGRGNGGFGHAEFVSALLHIGNKGNLERLVAGRGWGRYDATTETLDTAAWDGFLAEMVDKGYLTKDVMGFVQSVWDLNEEVKPLAQRAHKALFGTYFDEVETTPVKLPFGTYRGGYMPAKLDANAPSAGRIQSLQDLEKDFRNQFASTGRGFTRARAEHFHEPLLLDLDLVPSHIDEVLRFSHLQPTIRDVEKIAREKNVAALLEARQPGVWQNMLLPWLQRVASQSITKRGKNESLDAFWRHLRSSAGLSTMVANLANALQQLTGLIVAAAKVGPRFLAKGMWRLLNERKALYEDIASESPFIANRQHNQVFDSLETIHDLTHNRSKLAKARAWVRKHGYFLQSTFQNMVDAVVWSGAFEQSLAKSGRSKSDADARKEAVEAADAAVRMTQSSFEPGDVAGYEEGTPFYRIWTMFSGYFNTIANLQADLLTRMGREQGWAKAGPAFQAYVLAFAVPALLAEAITRTARGRWDDEDEDGDLDYLTFDYLFLGQLRAALAEVPVFGPSGLAPALNTFDNQSWNDRMTTSPAVSLLERSFGGSADAVKALFRDSEKGRPVEIGGEVIRDPITLLGLLLGLPLAGVGSRAGYAFDVGQGKVQPTGTLDYLRGLLTGAPGARR